MGGTLAGKTISTTYKDLLTINTASDNDGITSTLKAIEDGVGTNTALMLSTTDIAVINNGKLYLDGGSDTYIYSNNDVMYFHAGGEQMMRFDSAGSADGIFFQADTLNIMDTTGTSPRITIASDHTDLTASGDSGAVYSVHNIRMGGNDWGYGSLALGPHGDGWFQQYPAENYHRIEINGSYTTFNGLNTMKVGVGILTPLNFFQVAPIAYQTGTAYQTGNEVHGTGTTWTDSMIGRTIVFKDHSYAGVITARTSNTQVTVNVSQSVASTGARIEYKMHHTGLNVVATYGKVGMGTNDPQVDLDIQGRYNAAAQLTLASVGAGDSLININAGAVGQDSVIWFKNTADDSKGRLLYNHAAAPEDQYFQFYAGDGDELPLKIWGDSKIGVNKTSGPTAQLHVIGKDASTEPVLRLEQLDVDKPFIRFEGTTASDASRSTSTATTTSATIVRQVMVHYDGGSTGWIRIYDGVA